MACPPCSAGAPPLRNSTRSTADVGKVERSRVESEIRRPLMRTAARPVPSTKGRLRPKPLTERRPKSRSETLLMPDNAISVRSITVTGRTGPASSASAGAGAALPRAQGRQGPGLSYGRAIYGTFRAAVGRTGPQSFRCPPSVQTSAHRSRRLDGRLSLFAMRVLLKVYFLMASMRPDYGADPSRGSAGLIVLGIRKRSRPFRCPDTWESSSSGSS